MITKQKVTEADIAKSIVSYLHGNGWEVYQEVRCGRIRADIVAVDNKITWVIETKLSFNLNLMEQASRWIDKHMANYVSIGIPKLQYNDYAMQILNRLYGIGALLVTPNSLENVTREIPAKFQRTKKSDIRKFLYEEQKYFVDAGTNSTYFTPFKRTKENLIKVISENPGINLKDLIEKCSHHYRSNMIGRARISQLIQQGVIPEIRCERNKKSLQFYTNTSQKSNRERLKIMTVDLNENQIEFIRIMCGVTWNGIERHPHNSLLLNCRNSELDQLVESGILIREEQSSNYLYKAVDRLELLKMVFSKSGV